MSVQDKKNKSIQEAIRAIHKQFGSGSIMRLDGTQVQHVEVIPTGSVAIDVALGCGGLPRGRIVEIYGPESSGKTTLTLHAIAEAQRAGGVCAFIDAEHALDTEYARRLGVDLEDLLVSQPDCGEQALEIADTLVRTGAIDLIVVDSVAALTPRAEIEGDMGDSHMGLQARLMSQALRKLTAVIARTKTVVIFINQLVARERSERGLEPRLQIWFHLAATQDVEHLPLSGRTQVSYLIDGKRGQWPGEQTARMQECQLDEYECAFTFVVRVQLSQRELQRLARSKRAILRPVPGHDCELTSDTRRAIELFLAGPGFAAQGSKRKRQVQR